MAEEEPKKETKNMNRKEYIEEMKRQKSSCSSCGSGTRKHLKGFIEGKQKK